MSHLHARRAALLTVAALLLSAGAASADAARARKALDDHYIAFTPTEFVARADRNEVETVALFLEAGMPASAADDAGRTALHGAAPWDDGKLLALLLKAGAPVNARTREGDTPSAWRSRPTGHRTSPTCSPRALTPRFLARAARPRST